MPETSFQIQWPDGQQEMCYSPSSVVREYFQAGETYTLEEFLLRSQQAMQRASQRVQEVYGFPCSRAMGQLQRIEAAVKSHETTPNAQVVVLQI